MKRELVTLMTGLLVAIAGLAHTQNGIVRTLERPGKQSEGISGVTINVLEYPNAIVSKKGGKFSFSISGKRQGDAFTVTRVQKRGYTLVDKHIMGRHYAYSSIVPLEIVMVSNQQLDSDKKRIEDKAYDKAKRTYDQKLAALEQRLNQKTISEQEYRAKYEELSSNYNNYIQLIDQMAERYATTDYKGLSDTNKEILSSIENADMERADELINRKGSFDKREQEVFEKIQLKEKSEQLSQQLQEDINKELEELVSDYYSKFAIHASNYQNDSAAYYLERMVRLDTTNVTMLRFTASFIDSHVADYPRALTYYQRALTQAQQQYGEVSKEAGVISEFIGLTYDHMKDLDQSLQWHHKALDIYQQTEGLDNPDAALVYTHIGRIYNAQDSLEKALEYTLKGLDIRNRTIQDKDNQDFSQSYNNLGVIYTNMGDYEKAMEYHMKALEQRERVLGPNSDGTALSYLNIGSLYFALEDSDNALIYFQKSHDAYLAVYGPAHPYTIMTAQYMASAYYVKADLEKAKECYRQALAGCEQFYGPDHANSQKCREAIAKLEEMQKQQSSND